MEAYSWFSCMLEIVERANSTLTNRLQVRSKMDVILPRSTMINIIVDKMVNY